MVCLLTRLCQVVYEEVNFEGRGVRSAQSNATGKVSLDTSTQRDDAQLRDVDGRGELHQIQVEFLEGRILEYCEYIYYWVNIEELVDTLGDVRFHC